LAFFFTRPADLNPYTDGGSMDISIEKVESKGTEQWIVCIGSLKMSFNDQPSAMAFSSKLKERVEAPHSLPVIDSGAFEQVAELDCVK
tara:strand:+ start:649 stop:912 length:264 start_codon:yes stop_codon:yes gene_type:complete